MTWPLHKDFSAEDGTPPIIPGAPDLWRPFSFVYCEEYWEGRTFNPYCSRVPLKWPNPDGVADWMQFSGFWGPTGQKALYYRSNVRPFRLRLRWQKPANGGSSGRQPHPAAPDD